MQSNILSKNTDPRLRVFAIWVPFMAGTRNAVQTSVLADPRVTNLWDQNAISSQWFSRHLTHQPGPTWDYYILFGPSARWAAAPGPVISQDGTVLGTTSNLAAAIAPLLH